MAKQKEKSAELSYPVPQFRFEVRGGPIDGMRFSEVSGLEHNTGMLEYREGDDPPFTYKIPGLSSTDNLVLSKGVFKKDSVAYDWWNKLDGYSEDDDSARVNVKVSLLDEKGVPMMTWTVMRAFPVHVSSPELDAQGEEIAIEKLELAHEGIIQQAV